MNQATSRKRLWSLITEQTQGGSKSYLAHRVPSVSTKVESVSSIKTESVSTTTTKDKSLPTWDQIQSDSPESLPSTVELRFSAKDKDDLFVSVENYLIHKGYAAYFGRGFLPEKWYTVRALAGENLLGDPYKVDFLINGKVCVICRWQDTSGSAYEKWPFALNNLINSGMKGYMIVGGKGCKDSMVDYLKKIASCHPKVTVCTPEEFSMLEI